MIKWATNSTSNSFSFKISSNSTVVPSKILLSGNIYQKNLVIISFNFKTTKVFDGFSDKSKHNFLYINLIYLSSIWSYFGKIFAGVNVKSLETKSIGILNVLRVVKKRPKFQKTWSYKQLF